MSKNKNMFDDIVEQIPKSVKAAKSAQKMRAKETEKIIEKKPEEKQNYSDLDQRNLFKVRKRTKGVMKTFYLSKLEVEKIDRWMKKGYVISDIIRKLIQNAPEEF